MIGLSCSTVSCDGFEDRHFERTYDVAPQVGFKYVEFNCWHPSDLTPAGIQRMRRRCADVGLTPSAIYGSSFGGEGFGISKDVCHKLRMIEAALELGCRRVVCTGGKRGGGGGLDEIIIVLEQLVPELEKNDVLFCLENHAQDNLETIEDYQKVFAAIISAHVGMCVDTGHFDAANVDLDAIVDTFAGRINHIHVKEAIARGVTEFVRFGKGVTDNNHVVERILAHGYEGFISVELAIADKSNLVDDLRKPVALFSKYERA